MRRIALHSAPRSGSSWLGQIFNSSPSVNYKFQPLFSYSFKDALNLNSEKKDIISFFDNISKSNDEFLNQLDKVESGNYPIFEKKEYQSHIVYKEVRYHNLLKHLMASDNDLIVIGLIRNPKAVLSSWMNSPREFRKDLGWNFIEEWKDAPKKNQNRAEEYFGFNKWVESVEIFNYLETKYPDRLKIVNYKDLITETRSIIKEVFDFCGIEFSEQTENFIIESQSYNNNDHYSVFKMKNLDHEWKKLLPKDIIDEIDMNLLKRNLKKYLEE